MGLDLHTDDSDVTFNCNLGRGFKNATLTLCGLGAFLPVLFWCCFVPF